MSRLVFPPSFCSTEAIPHNSPMPFSFKGLHSASLFGHISVLRKLSTSSLTSRRTLLKKTIFYVLLPVYLKVLPCQPPLPFSLANSFSSSTCTFLRSQRPATLLSKDRSSAGDVFHNRRILVHLLKASRISSLSSTNNLIPLHVQSERRAQMSMTRNSGMRFSSLTPSYFAALLFSFGIEPTSINQSYLI